MNDFNSVIHSCFKNYRNFSGRAPRLEYNIYKIFQIVLSLIVAYIDIRAQAILAWYPFGVLSASVILITAVPEVSLSVRRLHDLNRSGWWYLLNFVPVMNLVLLFTLMFQQKSPEQ